MKIVMICYNTNAKYHCFICLKNSTLYCNYKLEVPALDLRSCLLQSVELARVPLTGCESENFSVLLMQAPLFRGFKMSEPAGSSSTESTKSPRSWIF